jgi:serine protease Do
MQHLSLNNNAITYILNPMKIINSHTDVPALQYKPLIALIILGTLLLTAQHSPAAPAEALGKLDFRKVVRKSKEQVFPAVVYVKCVRKSLERGKKQSIQVSGSGVLISASGELLTNWHVVDKASEIRCLLYNGQAYYAETIGTDKDLDVALLQLKMPKDAKPLPHADLGFSSKLVEGDFVMAMGAPWGLTRSVSIGIVSCTGRFLDGNSEYSLWLQADASISPGNSGGPLINTLGQVVGINTRGAIYGGDLGFAVPSDTIKEILPRLRQLGDIDWSWTGLKLQAIRDFNRNVYFEDKEGVIVSSTEQSSPARLAGVMDSDRIISVNGKKLNGFTEESLPEIRRFLALLPFDKPAKFDMLRDGTKVAIDITPRKKGSVEGKELDCPRWDLTVKAINQFDNRDLYFHRKEGVFMFGIKYPGTASTALFDSNYIFLDIYG